MKKTRVRITPQLLLRLLCCGWRLLWLLTTHSWRRRAAAPGWLLLLEWQPLVGRVSERRCHDDHRAGREERADHAAAHHLALEAGEVYGEA